MAPDPAARSLLDDCAVISLGSETLILTHDMMAEGVHWLPNADPADVAWKLVATNLSDLAAKGAEPLGVLLGYQLGSADERFISGLKQALDHYAVPLLGDIPILGALFKSESRNRKKTNLMVFLRPVVLRDENSTQVLSQQRYREMYDAQQQSHTPGTPAMPVPNDVTVPQPARAKP